MTKLLEEESLYIFILWKYIDLYENICLRNI